MVECTAAGRSLAAISSRAASSTPVGTVPMYAQALWQPSIFNQSTNKMIYKRKGGCLFVIILLLFLIYKTCRGRQHNQRQCPSRQRRRRPLEHRLREEGRERSLFRASPIWTRRPSISMSCGNTPSSSSFAFSTRYPTDSPLFHSPPQSISKAIKVILSDKQELLKDRLIDIIFYYKCQLNIFILGIVGAGREGAGT
jgi:hypothetical protein